MLQDRKRHTENTNVNAMVDSSRQTPFISKSEGLTSETFGEHLKISGGQMV